MHLNGMSGFWGAESFLSCYTNVVLLKKKKKPVGNLDPLFWAGILTPLVWAKANPIGSSSRAMSPHYKTCCGARDRT